MKQETKQRILIEGAKLIHLKGYGSTGLQEILKAAEVPKGSFYFYFKNKEDFGLQLIDFFKGNIFRKWDGFTTQTDLTPMEKLEAFFNWFLVVNEKNDFKGGCPFGNLGQELGDVNDQFQSKLESVISEFKEKIAFLLRQALDENEIKSNYRVEDLSDLIFSCFQGALIQMKVNRSSRSMLNFKNLIFDLIRSEKVAD